MKFKLDSSCASMLLFLVITISHTDAFLSTQQCSPPSSSMACPSDPSQHIQNLNDPEFHYRRPPTKLESRMSEQFSTYFDEEEVITMTPFESTFPFISRLVGSPGQARGLITFLRQETSDIRQIMLFAAVGYGIPFLGDSARKTMLGMDEIKYKRTRAYHVLNHISQGFKLGAITTLMETISEMILGVDTAITVVMTNAISSILFSIWGMYRVKVIKNLVVAHYCKRFESNPRLARFYEKASDYIIYAATVIIALDTLGFKYQTALKSISVFGGVGTIVISLASKDMSTQLLSGLSIKTSQQFDEGDEIKLESGELGTVERVGFLHTYIRGKYICNHKDSLGMSH